MNWCPDLVNGSDIYGFVSAEYIIIREGMVLFPRSVLVGEKTESTACAGGVQPGGGSFFAAAHADTRRCQCPRDADTGSLPPIVGSCEKTHVMPKLLLR